jgi:hypothetical protein
MWIVFIWLRIGTGGGIVERVPLKARESDQLNVIIASQEGLCSMELVRVITSIVQLTTFKVYTVLDL